MDPGPTPPEIDVETLLRSGPGQAGSRESRALGADLRTLDETEDLSAAPSVSRTPILAPLLAGLKRLLRKLLATPFAQQSAYNQASARAVRALSDRLDRLEEEVERLRRGGRGGAP